MPFLIPLAAVAGTGLAAYGAVQSYGAAKDSKAANAQLIAEQQQQDELRRKAMELDARRRQAEDVRNMQRARAQALATTTAQGASQGSALGGAYGQISGTTGNDLLSIGQNLSLGRDNFGITSQMNQTKLSLSAAQSSAATASALSSLGGTLISSLGPIGRLGGGINPSASATPAFGGG